MKRNIGCQIVVLITLVFVWLVGAGHVSGQVSNHFEAKVRPLLISKCASCHRGTSAAAGVDFATSTGIRAYVSSRNIRTETDAGARILMSRITAASSTERMPPTGERLTVTEVSNVRIWLNSGAKVPETARGGSGKLWSLQPITVQRGSSIDGLVDKLRRRQGLTQSQPADKSTLLRRVTFDLTGLPPLPAEIKAFNSDNSRTAYVTVVNRLLASKAYGEQQARYWLDVIHFGESHGFDKDKRRDDAFLYKHWVISAFNSDLAVDTFVKHQLAGDVLLPMDRSAVIATGFLAAGPWDFVGQIELPEDVVEKQKTRNLDRDDMLTSTMQTFTGLTVQCARCHDHKFDPIPQRDYYALQAVFAGVERASRPLPTVDIKTSNQGPSPSNGWHSAVEMSPDVSHWVQVTFDHPVIGREVRIIPARPTDFQDTPGFGFPERFRIDATFADGTATCLLNATNLDYPNPGSRPLQLAVTKPVVSVRITATRLWKRSDDFVFALAEVELWDGNNHIPSLATVESSSSIEQGRWSKSALVDGFDSRGTLLPTVYSLKSIPPRAVRLLSRGEVSNPLEVVEPEGLSCVTGVTFPLADWSVEGNRRLALATWITAQSNPLMWRTLANRIWITHFGQGLVETPNDFGWNGAQPANPELLDFLASELRRTRSFRHLHRMIVSSHTYQQASRNQSSNEAKDKGNRYYWKYSSRRLHAEEIRDAVLVSAGQLRPTTKDQPSFDLFGFRDDHSPEYRVDDIAPWVDTSNYRRSVYRFMVRSVPIPFFEVFDAPDPSVSVPVRSSSITPLQALTLSNHPFMRGIAPLAPALETPRSIRQMFLAVLGREPSFEELAMTQRFVFEHGPRNTWLAMWNSNGFLMLR